MPQLVGLQLFKKWGVGVNKVKGLLGSLDLGGHAEAFLNVAPGCLSAGPPAFDKSSLHLAISPEMAGGASTPKAVRSESRRKTEVSQQ